MINKIIPRLIKKNNIFRKITFTNIFIVFSCFLVCLFGILNQFFVYKCM